jgi:shikimate kinase
VVATGGGAVLREENRRALRDRGTVVYLMTTVEQQLKRTAKDRNRPLLQCANREQVLNDMFAARDPLYRATSDITVRTDRRSPRAVVNEILRRVHRLIDPLETASAPHKKVSQ